MLLAGAVACSDDAAQVPVSTSTTPTSATSPAPAPAPAPVRDEGIGRFEVPGDQRLVLDVYAVRFTASRTAQGELQVEPIGVTVGVADGLSAWLALDSQAQPVEAVEVTLLGADGRVAIRLSDVTVVGAARDVLGTHTLRDAMRLELVARSGEMETGGTGGGVTRWPDK